MRLSRHVLDAGSAWLAAIGQFCQGAILTYQMLSRLHRQFRARLNLRGHLPIAFATCWYGAGEPVCAGRASACLIPANIAEVFRRRSKTDKARA